MAKRSGFVAVDIQNAWAGNCPLTTRSIEKAADGARRKRMPVVWAYMDFLPADMKPMRYGDLKVTEIFRRANEYDPRKGTLFLPTLTPDDNDWVISKGTRSLTGNRHNAPFLREQLRLGALDLVGFRTAQCIKASAIGGLEEGFNVTVHSELTADRRDMYETAIESVFDGTGVILNNGMALAA